MDRAEITDYLRRVPDLVDGPIGGLSDEEMHRRPQPDAWSALEVLCHLRDYAEEEARRVRRLVEEDSPALETYDEQAWARDRGYQRQDVAPVHDGLRSAWTGLAALLTGLSDGEWERAGSHPDLGEVTVRSRAERQVRHARLHLEQLRALVQAS